MPTPHPAQTKAQLVALDEARDCSVCGMPLTVARSTHFADAGAHDPTATYYFVLEELFDQMDFTEESHLLDVGCSLGRTLAFFASAHIPGRATGVELDPELAQRCQTWTSRFPDLATIQGNALEIPLGTYTHFYLFNPFDTPILEKFVQRVEAEATHPITFCHMSDNGENYLFWGRTGWTLHAEGFFEQYENALAYSCPQHYSIWEFNPACTQ